MKNALVVIESPFAGDVDRNIEYARCAMRDSLMRDEHPIASHLLYTQPGILNDGIPQERMRGIGAGFAWGEHADVVAFYVDLGWSKGMKAAREYWKQAGKAVTFRRIPEWLEGRYTIAMPGVGDPQPGVI